MGRFPQPSDGRGSLKNIQVLINDHPALFADKIREALNLDTRDIKWVSPLRDDEYAEYKDGGFLKQLGIRALKVPLNHFWPGNGPQWDALGKGSNGVVFLVEALANITELVSHCGTEAPKSRRRIQRRFKETREFLKCRTSVDWTRGFYQYTSRIAHLYYLRHLNKINAYLIFIYFVNDTTHIPTSLKEWQGALQLKKNLLGLNRHKLSRYIAEVFVDEGEM